MEAGSGEGDRSIEGQLPPASASMSDTYTATGGMMDVNIDRGDAMDIDDDRQPVAGPSGHGSGGSPSAGSGAGRIGGGVGGGDNMERRESGLKSQLFPVQLSPYPKASITGSHDLLTLFDLMPVYDEYVRPYLPPGPPAMTTNAGQTKATMTTDAGGQNGIKVDVKGKGREVPGSSVPGSSQGSGPGGTGPQQDQQQQQQGSLLTTKTKRKKMEKSWKEYIQGVQGPTKLTSGFISIPTTTTSSSSSNPNQPGAAATGPTQQQIKHMLHAEREREKNDDFLTRLIRNPDPPAPPVFVEFPVAAGGDGGGMKVDGEGIENVGRGFALLDEETLARGWRLDQGVLQGFDNTVWLAEEQPKKRRKKKKHTDNPQTTGSQPTGPGTAATSSSRLPPNTAPSGPSNGAAAGPAGSRPNGVPGGQASGLANGTNRPAGVKRDREISGNGEKGAGAGGGVGVGGVEGPEHRKKKKRRREESATKGNDTPGVGVRVG